MIQFNLLPDVKLDYIKARRSQHSVVAIGVMAAGGALVILILLFMVVNVIQKKHMRDLNGDIKSYSNKLEEIKDLDKILTVQNQLNSLPDLHNKKVVASRLLPFISQITPAQVSISNLNIDFNAHTISLTGTAGNLETVNKFTDTLKFTTFTAGEQSGENAFSNVVLAGFGKGDKNSTYQISASYDPLIFDSANDVKLIVPKIISTRSETEKPDALFQQSPPSNGDNP